MCLQHFPILPFIPPRFNLSYNESADNFQHHCAPRSSTYDCRTEPSGPRSQPVGFSPVPDNNGLLTTKPQSSSSSVEKDDSLLHFLLDEVLQHDEDGASDFMFDKANDDVFDDCDLELADLTLPVSCTRSTSCLSVNSDWLTEILEGDASSDSWLNSIVRTGNWMADDDVHVDEIEVEKVVAADPPLPLMATVEQVSRAPRIPTPEFSVVSTLPFCGVTTGSSSNSGVFKIPRPSKEFLIEGMTYPSFSQGDIKKQKIARYLEKRKRRLSRKSNKPRTSTAFSTRREIANKRARVNGRFVSVSEFGSAPKRRR